MHQVGTGRAVSDVALETRTVSCEDSDFSVLARAVLERGALLRFRATGMSMRPFLQDGDLLQVRAVRGQDLKPGDIVLVVVETGKVVVHRVLSSLTCAGAVSVLVKGDRAASTDGCIRCQDVLGRVVARERAGRTTNLRGAGWRACGRLVAWASALGLPSAGPSHR